MRHQKQLSAFALALLVVSALLQFKGAFKHPLLKGKPILAPVTHEAPAPSRAHKGTEPESAPPVIVRHEYVISRNETFYEALKWAGFDSSTVHALIEVAKKHYDVGRISPGTVLTTAQIEGYDEVIALSVKLSALDELKFKRVADHWDVELHTKPLERRTISFAGKIESTLWDSAAKSGCSPAMIYRLSDVFAWQIDFEREPRPGDSWSLVVEEHLVDGVHYDWGAIRIAKYIKAALGDEFWGVRYPQDGDKDSYYDLDGKSLQGAFLKSPLQFSRISSRFALKRFHPVLGYERPHYGVDYAAPYGTPIRSVGDGRVKFAGRRGGAGKMIHIKHSSTHETAYKHLSRFAGHLVEGSQVKQGEIIGYVGATGLATGPHLHFEFYENGAYVDPLGKKFPRENMLATTKLPNFRKVAQRLVKLLPTDTAVAKKEIRDTNHAVD